MGSLGSQELAFLILFTPMLWISHLILRRALPRWGKQEETGGKPTGHLFQQRSVSRCLLLTLVGIAVAFIISLTFSQALWRTIEAAVVAVLRQLGAREPALIQTSALETFGVVFAKLPLLTAVFMASPWIFYQVWIFVQFKVDDSRRRWGRRMVAAQSCAFILGGLIGCFVVFPRYFEFLVGIDRNTAIVPMVGVSAYADLLVITTLGTGLMLECPVFTFGLVILRVTSVERLLATQAYIALIMALSAAIVTPTPDVLNLIVLFLPLLVSFYAGILIGIPWSVKRKLRLRRFITGGLLLCLDLILSALSAGVVLFWRHVPALLRAA